MEPISALENLSQDYYWLPAFLNWIGELVKNLSPLIALVGAIYLYYKKAAAERAELRRDERRKVYAEYIHQCGLLWNEVTTGPTSGQISMQTSNLLRFLEELRLLAPKNVYVRAFELRAEYIKFGSHVLSMTPDQWVNKTSEQKSQDSMFVRRISTAMDDLISIMKEDLSR